MIVKVPVSVGELFDKYTILNIKYERIEDPYKCSNIKYEMEQLEILINEIDFDHKKYLLNQLKTVNEELWEIEDNIRRKDKLNQFDEEFIEIAKSVYKKNDKRFILKTLINQTTNSKIIEEKSH